MSKRVWLECDHILWLSYPVTMGEQLWCVRCQQYRTAGEPTENANTYHPDYQWLSRPISAYQHRGECAVTDCEYVRRGPFEKVRAALELHHIMQHTLSSLIKPREVKLVEKLPKNSSPPF